MRAALKAGRAAEATYFRNQAMDSIDFFSKRAKAAKPDNKQNQYGGNVGGPLIKDHAFFFADYEGTRITRGVTRLTSVQRSTVRYLLRRRSKLVSTKVCNRAIALRPLPCSSSSNK